MATVPETLAAAREHLQAGRLERARELCQQVLQTDPDHADAWHWLGVIAGQLDEVEPAIEHIRRAIESNPLQPAFHNNLGMALSKAAKYAEAAESFRRAVELNPAYGLAHSNLGAALRDQGKPGDAVACHRRAAQLRPNHVESHCNLGTTLYELGRLDDAVVSLRRALRLDPDHAGAHNGLANVLRDQGKLDEAAACYRRALEIDPDHPAAPGNLVLLEHYRPGVTPRRLTEVHTEWERQQAARYNSVQSWPNARDPERPLRLGFVSPDFRRHPVGYFFVRALEALRSQPCETVCYSDVIVCDDLTTRIAGAADTWREVAGESDDALAEQIRTEQIDILFDLTGHTARNRLLVFARRAAPIQASWIGYVGTTGLAAMDYLIADPHHVPPSCDEHYRETVVRLPGCRVCFDPASDAPKVGPLPAQARGHVTFGSFNRPTKISEQVVDAWAEILRRVPAAQLVMKYRGLDHGSTPEHYRELFADRGVDPARIELQGSSAYGEMLAEYNRIDVALDPFPFSGGATSCEALWMGVPIVTYPMETFASRQTLSFLTNIGAAETVAQDRGHYVDLAAGLASDLPRLAELRSTLRERMAASPLCDGNRLATDLLDAFRGAWRDWCRRAEGV